MLLTLGILGGHAQQRKIQHKPYIDLRPLHFGILVGAHLQDIEFENVGPQTLVDEEGNAHDFLIVTDADKWNPGFSVGVFAEMRLHENFALRFTPTMHFGAKHLSFIDLLNTDEEGRHPKTTQDMKNTYVALPVNIKFAAPRWNNYRPYMMAGINGMINLTSASDDYVSLKRFSTMVEVGIGCDFYLPFFKLIPELKFCYGLSNDLDTNHINELRDFNKHPYAGSVSKGQNKMIMLTLYFE
jgi:hypothetical protein